MDFSQRSFSFAYVERGFIFEFSVNNLSSLFSPYTLQLDKYINFEISKFLQIFAIEIDARKLISNVLSGFCSHNGSQPFLLSEQPYHIL